METCCFGSFSPLIDLRSAWKRVAVSSAGDQTELSISSPYTARKLGRAGRDQGRQTFIVSGESAALFATVQQRGRKEARRGEGIEALREPKEAPQSRQRSADTTVAEICHSGRSGSRRRGRSRSVPARFLFLWRRATVRRPRPLRNRSLRRGEGGNGGGGRWATSAPRGMPGFSRRQRGLSWP